MSFNGKSILFTITLSILISSSAFSVEMYPWPYAYPEAKPDPRLLVGELENGLRYIFMSNSTPKKHVSLRLVVNCGSLMEEDSQRGLAHFIEHMAFRGGKRFPGNSYKNHLAGHYLNAHTSYNQTVFEIDLNKNQLKLLKNAMNFLRDCADGISFDEDAIETERKVVLSEMLERDSIDNQMTTALLGFVFQKSIFGKRSPIGLKSILQKVKKEIN